MNEDRSKALKEIEDEVEALTDSELTDFRRENKYLYVCGEGSPFAKIMLIGEAPGKNEALSGRPFCGSAGKILDELLKSVEIKREDVYITSIVKDRPPKNRDPRPDEINLYAPFLDKQIEIIKPKVLAVLGRFSMQYVMNRYGLGGELAPISSLHGKVFEAEMPWLARPDVSGHSGRGDKVKVVPLYHPAAVIYNQKLKETLKEDFQVLKTLI